MFQSISIFAALAGFDRKESIGIITILAAIEKKPIPLFKFIGMTILFAVRIRVCGGGNGRSVYMGLFLIVSGILLKEYLSKRRVGI